jgi:hypothetical protein
MGVISRMAIEYAREMLERAHVGPGTSGIIERIEVPPVRLSLDVMSDRAAARQIADAIRRAVTKEVGS